MWNVRWFWHLCSYYWRKKFVFIRFRTFPFYFKQKERDRQRSAAKKIIHNNEAPVRNSKKMSTAGDNRGEFDDLISALRTGDVFGDELSKMKGRRRTAPPKQGWRVENGSERERASPRASPRILRKNWIPPTIFSAHGLQHWSSHNWMLFVFRLQTSLSEYVNLD